MEKIQKEAVVPMSDLAFAVRKDGGIILNTEGEAPTKHINMLFNALKECAKESRDEDLVMLVWDMTSEMLVLNSCIMHRMMKSFPAGVLVGNDARHGNSGF